MMRFASWIILHRRRIELISNPIANVRDFTERDLLKEIVLNASIESIVPM
jgi:hypothetical protein